MKTIKSIAKLTGIAAAFFVGAVALMGAENGVTFNAQGFVASTACLLVGGASCTMTGQVVISGVAADISTGTNEDLTLAPNGTGEVVLQSGDSKVSFATSDGTSRAKCLSYNSGMNCGDQSSGGSFQMDGGASGEFWHGTGTSRAATGLVDVLATALNGSVVYAREQWGSGLQTVGQVQTCTCSASACTVDPQSSVIEITTGGANCNVTVQTTTAAAVSTGTGVNQGKAVQVMFIQMDSAGAGKLKIVSDTNNAVPALCKTTGLSAAGSTDVATYDKALAKWVHFCADAT